MCPCIAQAAGVDKPSPAEVAMTVKQANKIRKRMTKKTRAASPRSRRVSFGLDDARPGMMPDPGMMPPTRGWAPRWRRPRWSDHRGMPPRWDHPPDPEQTGLLRRRRTGSSSRSKPAKMAADADETDDIETGSVMKAIMELQKLLGGRQKEQEALMGGGPATKALSRAYSGG